MEFIGNTCIVALLSYGGYLVMQNQLNPGELVAFFSLVNYMMWPIMNLGFVINMFSQAKASGERLLDILEKEEDITDHPHALHKQKLTGDVHFKNVSLAYGKEQTNALCNVSFEANSGKVIGLLGPTGSGKSSVTQLLTRFYSPVGGMITIDHKPITDYSLKTLRSNIGVVLQESFLFSSTIRSNIRMGGRMPQWKTSSKRQKGRRLITLLWSFLMGMTPCWERGEWGFPAGRNSVLPLREPSA